jgi:hypothetical protein
MTIPAGDWQIGRRPVRRSLVFSLSDELFQGFDSAAKIWPDA